MIIDKAKSNGASITCYVLDSNAPCDLVICISKKKTKCIPVECHNDIDKVKLCNTLEARNMIKRFINKINANRDFYFLYYNSTNIPTELKKIYEFCFSRRGQNKAHSIEACMKLLYHRNCASTSIGIIVDPCDSCIKQANRPYYILINEILEGYFKIINREG